MDDDDDWDNNDLPEDHVHFQGPCTCVHAPEDHGWVKCEVNEGEENECECEASWEE